VYERLVASQPEPLVPHMRVGHATLLNVLDRPGDGCAAMVRLLTDNDEPRRVQRRLVRRSIAIYRSLLGAGALERLDEPDELGRRVRVTAELQPDFALDNPLSPFVLEAVPRLDAGAPTFALDVTSVVESTLADPAPVLQAQLDRVKTEALARMKAAGVEYEERIAELEKLEYPKPLREFTYELFDRYRVVHPWAADDNIRPKSVARDLYEQAMTYGEYVAHYGLQRSEGLVLRYLSEVYRGLVRAVPEELKTEELLDLTEWLGELVRQVDSSLIDEWQHLAAASASSSAEEAAAEIGREVALELGEPPPPPPVTANRRAFKVMLRNAAFRRVELAARRDAAALAGAEQPGGLDEAAWSEALEGYYALHDSIGTGAPARAAAWFQVTEAPGRFEVRQVLDDPDGDHDTAILAEIDLAASDEAGAPAWRTLAVTSY
ncbi:MAG TPA: DUF3516 domain-containing protein, partial [Acidimicrobiales bacterium]|nr:DUF3516 domain-containing protein [Acidimicrobiales bacterium]